VAPSLHLHDLESDGVTLVSPLRPDFDSLARPLLGERIADIGLGLKPMLVIVRNQSPRTIVSFAIVWRIAYPGGRTHVFWCHTSFPDVVCGDVSDDDGSRGLEPGQQRIQARGLAIHQYGHGNPYFDQFLGQFVTEKDTMLRNAVELHIDLNAVIFANGTLAGPDDESTLLNYFSAYVRAKQEWYRGIRDALDRGQTVAESFNAVESFSAGVRAAMRERRRFGPDNDPEFWKIQAAGEAIRWRRRIGDESVPRRLRERIRLAHFVISREG
jgi:hypothetical protein